MADRSAIEWTDATWNPVRARNRATGKLGWFCTHVSTACANCYAEKINARLGTGLPFKPGHLADVEVFLDERMLTQPLRWKKPRMIFVGSMTDLFADFVTDAMLDRIFAVMALTPQHTFQLLTKRPERMRAYLSAAKRNGVIARQMLKDAPAGVYFHNAPCGTGRTGVTHLERWPLPNVWLGVSVEDQRRADERIPVLLDTPAAVKWISAEPLLGPVDVMGYLFIYTHDDDAQLACAEHRDTPLPFNDPATTDPAEIASPRLDWVVAGGESGPGARPMHPDWARALRDECAGADVPFLFKQWGAWIDTDDYVVANDILVDGERPATPLTFAAAAALARAGGFAREHHSDGSTRLRVGKKAAGRLLDGVVHDAYPERRP